MDASLGARRGLRYHAAGDVTLFGLAAAAPFRASRRQGGKARRERGESQSTVTTAVRGHQREDQGCPQGAASRIQALGALAGNKIAAMAAGPEHAFVCFADKTILSTGSNFFGQLGTGSDGLSQKAFAPLELRHPIVSVSCGRAHTIMATLYGEVYACGSNTSGQLGLGDFEDRLVLTRSDLSQWTVISVAAGENHTLAVTKRGQLYSFGSNSEGQLGISRPQDQANRTFCNRTDDLTSKAKPTLIQFEPELAASRRPLAFEVLQMCCGARHCMAIVRTWRMDTQEVISERDLFSWGSNRHGQLGKSRVCEYQGTPRWVKIHPAQQRKQLPDDFADPPAKAREGDPSSMLWYDSSGESQGSDLDAASATSSQWEWGGYGEVPVAGGKNKKSSGFQKLNASAIRHEEMISVRKAPRRVSCGAEFTLIVTADSSVYACGCCDKGQLGVRGMKDRDEPSLVSALHGKAVTDVACGREHAFALVKDGAEIYGWGRNTEAQVGMTASSYIEYPTLLPGLDLGAGTTSEIASTAQNDELGSVQRCCASVVAGDKFSVFGRLNIDGFPKQDPAANVRYDIPGDIIICELGAAIPRYLPYVEGSPPFVFSSEPPMLDGLHINPSNGQLHGHPLVTPGHHVIRYAINVYSECCPMVISSCTLKMRIVDAKVADKPVKKTNDGTALVERNLAGCGTGA